MTLPRGPGPVMPAQVPPGRVPAKRKAVRRARAGNPPSKPSMRREHPDPATREPAPDDEEIFGEAWPLIVEWRELKDRRTPTTGRGLRGWRPRERLLVVELALLEEHEMTLPPEKQPLRGLDRSGQVNWRRTAL